SKRDWSSDVCSSDLAAFRLRRECSEYLTELSGAFATEPERSVWLQEIGAPLNVLEAAEAPDFCTRAVRHAADCTNLWGVTWWCRSEERRVGKGCRSG